MGVCTDLSKILMPHFLEYFEHVDKLGTKGSVFWSSFSRFYRVSGELLSHAIPTIAKNRILWNDIKGRCVIVLESVQYQLRLSLYPCT